MFRFWTLLLSVVCAGIVVFASEQKTCPRFHIKAVKKRTIVQARASVANGAIYLGLKDVSGFHDCYNACCEKPTCNMVNLKISDRNSKSENDGSAKCYMFDCGTPWKCVYHSKTANLFERNSDVANYAVLEFEEMDDPKMNPKSSSKNHPSDKRVQDTTTKSSWRNRKTKAPSWFDRTTTETLPWPQKKADWFTKNPTTTNPPTTNPPSTTVITTTTTTKQLPRRDETTKEYGGYDGSKYSFDRDHGVTRQDERTPVPTTEPELDFPRRVWVDNNPNFPELPKSHDHKISRSTNAPVTEKKWVRPTNKETSPKGSDKPKQPKTTEKPAINSVVIKRFNIQENKAVIPLAVGLVLSLLLLMAVIFRLKSSRRRRTKAFLTDDADYLINGMYL